MTTLERLRELARNLYWTWHPELIEIFRDLDPTLWREAGHNPVEFLEQLDTQTLEDQAADLALDARISQAFHRMQGYLSAWDTWGARHAGPLHARPVVYFSAEFGLHESLPIYSGGLGVLAGDHLKSASDLDVPLVGVGLFYAEGYFHQRIDQNGWQQEEYSVSDVDKLPLDRARDEEGRLLTVTVRTRQSEIHVGLWCAEVGRSKLILLDTNVEGNSDEDRALTAQLYGGGRRERIRQELVLGVGGLRAIDALGICAGAIHLNEGHSAFATLELARQLMQRDCRPFHEIVEKVSTRTVFTTHTPVSAGHDRFEPDLVEEILGPVRDELGLEQKDFLALGRVHPEDDREPFCMTTLSLRLSQHRNAVSARHGRVSRMMWKDVWADRPADEIPIGHITNGIHVESWLAVPMAPLFDRHLGLDWREKIDDPRTWEGLEQIDDAEFWEQHQILQVHLTEYVNRRLRAQCEQRGEEPPPRFSPEALTIGFARRFAAYKRADLLLSDPERLAKLLEDADRPLQIVYAGMAHPDNEEGKKLIQRVLRMMGEEPFRGKLAFIEDHDMNVGRHLVQGADLWLNTPRRPLEACGTSGQKVVLNGGLNLSILDGWWAQAYDGLNGFAIGCGDECSDPGEQDRRDAADLYDVLENEVVPLFYDRDREGIPHGWVRRQKRAIRTLAWRFSARRMVKDYTLRYYLPAAGAPTAQTF